MRKYPTKEREKKKTGERNKGNLKKGTSKIPENLRKTILSRIGQLRVERRDKSREENGVLSKSKEQTPLITSSTARSPTVHVHAPSKRTIRMVGGECEGRGGEELKAKEKKRMKERKSKRKKEGKNEKKRTKRERERDGEWRVTQGRVFRRVKEFRCKR